MNIHVISSRQMIRDISTLYLARIDDVHLQTYCSLAEYLQAQYCPQKELADRRASDGHDDCDVEPRTDARSNHPGQDSFDGARGSQQNKAAVVPGELGDVVSWLGGDQHPDTPSYLGAEKRPSTGFQRSDPQRYKDILLVDIQVANRLDVVGHQPGLGKDIAVCVMDAQMHAVELETLLVHPVRALLQLDEVGRNLYDILCQVRAGKTVLTRSAALKFIESQKFSVSQATIVDDSLSQQTSQEFERALDLFVVFGFSRTDIAHNLCITTHAVSSRIRSGYTKYSVNDRKQAFDCLIGPHALGSMR